MPLKAGLITMRAHLMDESEHFLVVRPHAFFDAIQAEGLGRRTATLIERGNEIRRPAHFFEMLIGHEHLG